MLLKEVITVTFGLYIQLFSAMIRVNFPIHGLDHGLHQASLRMLDQEKGAAGCGKLLKTNRKTGLLGNSPYNL